jgi:hypothetical protein
LQQNLEWVVLEAELGAAWIRQLGAWEAGCGAFSADTMHMVLSLLLFVF